MSIRSYVCAAFAAAGIFHGAEANASLLVNGSFEDSYPGMTWAESVKVGTNINGWTVVGPGGLYGGYPLVVLASTYYENGGAIRFTAQDGNRSLDLTGNGNQGPNGVSQTVSTTPGSGYELAFYVGNQDNSFWNYASASAISLLINGVTAGIFVNGDNSHNNLNWKKFTYDFVADTSSTTIAFINATPLSDHEAGLDNVSLVQLASTVPEPATLALTGAGLIGLAAMRRRKAR